jgi:hypothetical protein
MLQKQIFITKNYNIELSKVPVYGIDLGTIKVIKAGNAKRGEKKEQTIELSLEDMRELVNILKDSPYIFSERNKWYETEKHPKGWLDFRGDERDLEWR